MDSIAQDPQPAPGTEEVLHVRTGAVARIILNRPRAINALTLPMIEAISALLNTWADDTSVQTVTIEGAGERGLCAGGDVVAARREALAGTDHMAFFAAEYAMNSRLASYPKPVVAFMDGIVMGGGVGVAAFARQRLVTERSKVAMPETIIGFFPDVGAMYLLSRAPGELGTHLALTGATVRGGDAIATGLADRQIDSGQWPELLNALADGGPLPPVGDTAPSSELSDQRSWIDECYAGDDAAAIVRRLENHPNEQARGAGEILRQRSPLSVAVTLEGLRRAATMETVQEVLDQDLQIADHLVTKGDFAEGVRAQLVDKDRSPKWKHARLEDVTRDEVIAAFG
ncbi:enoyl-CoA hydratase/isomerase family protein [Demetria terragena]|uniref:enoyl-CoA hydratase/isomerase family protein n=1 Tax=Demetria terragena TaxID=63959 RepID=UPI000367E2A9|nr:enoyl-CoA hydratase/isomerase family protein [Demetria terragena]